MLSSSNAFTREFEVHTLFDIWDENMSYFNLTSLYHSGWPKKRLPPFGIGKTRRIAVLAPSYIYYIYMMMHIFMLVLHALGSLVHLKGLPNA